MELSPSWEAASCAAAQELPIILYNPEGSLPCSQEPSTGPYPELCTYAVDWISYSHVEDATTNSSATTRP
jgi:hypothetical protein